MNKLPLRTLAVLFAFLLVFGCGQKAEAPPEPVPEASAASPESLPTSETATKSEEALEAAPAPEAPAAEEASLPPDHWLVGTSDVEDMVAARIAPEAPRKVLDEYDGAYLEQIGSTRVLHVKGSYYDMGFQHGYLMKEEIKAAAAMIHAIGQFEWKKDYDTSIKDAWDRTSPHIPDKFEEEMKGMAEATGMTIEQVQEFNIFPELFHCSGFALWGKAAADGTLLHGRVLDYMREVGLDKYALVIIQEPEGANAFVNVAYSGMLGSVTGMNVKQVAIGEMGGKGAEKWDGLPMSFLIRECLESASTLEEARKIMEESPRTCQYYYVISDAKADGGRGSALGVAAETDSIIFIKPGEGHPQLARPQEDTVLISGSGRYDCLVDRVEKQYGKFDPKMALDLMARGVSMNSNMHNALFKPATLEMWVTNSTVDDPACNLPYTYYDLNKLMSTKPE